MSTVFDTYKRPHPEAVFMDINPEIAEVMLATSTGNRRQRPTHEKFLAGCMQRGEWRITNQGIGFDRNGRLRDGHHRLNSVMKSGVTVPFLVVMGLCDEVYSIVDNGMARTYGDLLQTDDRFAGLCRFGHRLISTRSGTVKASAEQLHKLADSDFGSMARNLIEYAPKRRRFVSAAPITTAAVIWLLEASNQEYILKQYRALVLEDYEAMTPRIAAFNRFLSRTEAVDEYRGYVRALEAFNPDKAQNKLITFKDGDDKKRSLFGREVLRGVIGDVA